MPEIDIKAEAKRLLEDALKATGRELAGGAEEVARYAAERAAHLARCVGQPGFIEAVRAERDNVALHAGIRAVTAADAADDRLVRTIQAVLLLGVSAVARV